MSLNSLTNFDIFELTNKMKLPLNNILMKDKPDEINKDGFYIINLDDSNGEGTHWTVCYYHPLKSYYNDSFGFVPPIQIEEKLKPYKYNDADIQDYNSKACGWYCIAFIKFLHDKNNKEVAFNEFLRMFSKDTKENDGILKRYLDVNEKY